MVADSFLGYLYTKHFDKTIQRWRLIKDWANGQYGIILVERIESFVVKS